MIWHFLVSDARLYTVRVVLHEFLVNSRLGGDSEVHKNYAQTAAFLDCCRYGLEIKVFIVSLSTRSAESTRAVTVTDAQREWWKVLSMPIPLDTQNLLTARKSPSVEPGTTIFYHVM